jgi:transcriptional regulator of acetoin/glycerol metabolism
MTTQHTRVIRDAADRVTLERRLLRVQVKGGPDRGQKSECSDERIVIGTHASCQVVLTDPTISRQHCEIVLCTDGYLLRDLDSTNGTYLDQHRVSEIILGGGARLRLGKTVLAVDPLDKTVRLPLAADRFGPLIGRSVQMRRVFENLQRFAEADLTVLILGESGTGKEVAAQAIHQASARAAGPFVVVDCGALPGPLIESELFGHTRGAFTGANTARDGAFVNASGGTIFLDEIGELPLELQSRLLGAIERRQVTPVGAS